MWQSAFGNAYISKKQIAFFINFINLLSYYNFDISSVNVVSHPSWKHRLPSSCKYGCFFGGFFFMLKTTKEYLIYFCDLIGRGVMNYAKNMTSQRSANKINYTS